MYTQSSPKPGTDSVSFYMDFGLNSKRFGTFTVSQISRNGQLYTEPTFQVVRKYDSRTIEKIQQLRFGDYELRILCFLKEDLLKGELEMITNEPQFVKDTSTEHKLEQSHKVREISIGRNRRPYVTFLQYIKDNHLQLMYKFDFFVKRRTMSSNK